MLHRLKSHLALVEVGPHGDWVSTSWDEYWQAVRDLAKGLISLGVQSGDGVCARFRGMRLGTQILVLLTGQAS